MSTKKGTTRNDEKVKVAPIRLLKEEVKNLNIINIINIKVI